MGIARGILMDGDETGNATALLILAAHRVTGAFRRDHENVDRLLRLDEVEMNVEAMGEGDRRAVTDIRRNLVAPDIGLQFVRCCHHHEIGPLGRFRNRHHLETVGFRLLGRGRTGAKRHRYVLGAGIMQVEGMRPPLAAIAYDADLLALDQVNVGIPVVVNAHVLKTPLKSWPGIAAARPEGKPNGQIGTYATDAFLKLRRPESGFTARPATIPARSLVAPGRRLTGDTS